MYRQPLERIEHTSYGLHYANVLPDHPRILQLEAHLLPALDLVVTRFTRRKQDESHLYLDMASMEPGPQYWTVRDLYLDVSMLPDGTPRLVDSDEFAEAVLEGHLTPEEQRRALLSAERAVNGLFAHQHDLHAWLGSLGIVLDWWSAMPDGGR